MRRRRRVPQNPAEMLIKFENKKSPCFAATMSNKSHTTTPYTLASLTLPAFTSGACAKHTRFSLPHPPHPPPSPNKTTLLSCRHSQQALIILRHHHPLECVPHAFTAVALLYHHMLNTWLAVSPTRCYIYYKI